MPSVLVGGKLNPIMGTLMARPSLLPGKATHRKPSEGDLHGLRMTPKGCQWLVPRIAGVGVEDGLSKALFLLCGLRPSHVVGAGVGQGCAQGFGTPARFFISLLSTISKQERMGKVCLGTFLLCAETS